MSCDSMATVEVLRLGRDRSYSGCDAHAECELRKERERLNEGASIESKDGCATDEVLVPSNIQAQLQDNSARPLRMQRA
jgi:hypothetical protein